MYQWADRNTLVCTPYVRSQRGKKMTGSRQTVENAILAWPTGCSSVNEYIVRSMYSFKKDWMNASSDKTASEGLESMSELNNWNNLKIIPPKNNNNWCWSG